jgi:hypothetical protein
LGVAFVSFSSRAATGRAAGKRKSGRRAHPVIALLILVFVDAHDAATPLPGALARAAEEALGSGVSVSIRTVEQPPPIAGLADAGRAERAAAVARIAWTDERRTQARLEVIGAEGGPTRASNIAFADSDPLAERGRALGLVLAALVAPEKQARLEREAAARGVAAPAPTVVVAPPPPSTAPPRRFALDAAVEGGFALDGDGSGVGGALGLRWFAGHRLGLRAGVQARFGEVASAQATSLDLAAAVGLMMSVIPPSDERRFGLAVRADALLLYQSLSHLSQDDVAPVQSGRILPGAAALLEGQWAVSPTLALLLAGGAEIAFGRTDVIVHLQKVAELAPFRLMVQGGLVAQF